MQRLILPLLLFIVLTVPAYAITQEYGDYKPYQDYYFGLSIGHGVHVEDSLEEYDLNALVARLGYNYTKAISFEARYGMGLSADDIGPLKRELTSLFGAYALYNIAIDKKFNSYAIFGYSDVEIEQTLNNQKTIFTQRGPSLGVGFEYQINRRARWIVEAMAYVEGDANYGTISGGFRVNF